ncbi:sodium- and chloride-dependent glycine transporter 1-like [Chelonus insularis]|uniref:sodium- and chloride-dependent glycine transporter 1-like n=1 Tax=Chelonus insularis TaxID=460826 RepID=UPI00158D9115|nr:sodium- and chloride-dependent glycine transporter 1-like [Chelonus insularis]
MTLDRLESPTAKKKLSFGVGGAFVELPVERTGWANKTEFVLSCIGYAVGIGNVWRFPFLVYRNGGGAFLVPFILMLITMGLPIFFMELCMGQYTGVGPVEAYKRMSPAFGGIGLCTLVVIAFVTVYYMVLISWTLFYTFASFSKKLSWAYCDNDFNTEKCYSAKQDEECFNNDSTTIFFNKTCRAIREVCKDFGYHQGGNKTHCFNQTLPTSLHSLYPRNLSSEEYFNYYVLRQQDATWDHWGNIRWELFGYLTVGWIICYLCLIRGVQSVGKVVYFTALFPYFVLIALLIRGVTLEGAAGGIRWFIEPNWSHLLSAKVWGDAASQIFYSLGIGCGSLITISSFSTFSNNCHRDAIVITLTNLFTSIFAGIVIFSIVGYLAKQMDVPITEVAREGPALAFIAYPEAVVRMPLANLWAVLFFFMLFILGLGSQFAGVQAIHTAILDLRPGLRKHESLLMLAICFCGWLLALPMVFDGGIYLYMLMDWNTASWAVLLIGLFEVAVPAWCYGCNKFLGNISEMQMPFGILVNGYWWLSWMFLTPITCVGVFIYQLSKFESGYYNAYVYPKWADMIGILIGLATLAPLPLYFLYCLWKGPRDMSLFRLTDNWGPSQKTSW